MRLKQGWRTAKLLFDFHIYWYSMTLGQTFCSLIYPKSCSVSWFKGLLSSCPKNKQNYFIDHLIKSKVSLRPSDEGQFVILELILPNITMILPKSVTFAKLPRNEPDCQWNKKWNLMMSRASKSGINVQDPNFRSKMSGLYIQLIKTASEHK